VTLSEATLLELRSEAGRIGLVALLSELQERMTYPHEQCPECDGALDDAGRCKRCEAKK